MINNEIGNLKVLVVEDDKGISDFILPELEHEGFTTILAETGRQALEKFESENPDLILLDVMLPELNGLEVLRRIRSTSNVPIILETARGETVDKITGLNAGADDYIAKPFEIEELLARINALFRRISFMKSSEPNLSVRSLSLNTGRMSCTIEGNEIQLSKTEFLMLKCFIENHNKVLSRSDIIDNIWGKGHFIDENTVDVYVGYIRAKIAEHSKDEFIKTVRGAGYMMV
ncbi:MAG: response regulator transcription factor [Treponema sp.]|uniref:response regulator transcription factor n=1 Tax=Treponema sp. TaxID=166 RepID=UPI001B767823|nr:response regulator transcription factor [Treponema sp.]MBP3771896.1 response regulator transcription factor [Treponema sp.]MBQ9281884.1 response regulator transcription factor [Treponema sp.]